MRHYKRSNEYRASNVTFNPETKQAYSYGWWRFVDVINGKVVFNNYSYSVSTSGHQSKVRSLLRSLGIQIDLFIEAPCGLQDRDLYNEVKKHYQDKIDTLRAEIAAPRSRKVTNGRRLDDIKSLQWELQVFRLELEKKNCLVGREVV